RKAFHFFLVERQSRQPGDMLHLFLRNRHGPVPPSAMSCENARLLPLPSYDSIAQTGRLNPSAPQVSPGSARKLGDVPNNGETFFFQEDKAAIPSVENKRAPAWGAQRAPRIIRGHRNQSLYSDEND